MTIDNNAMTQTFSLNTIPLIHVHKGIVVSEKNNLIKIKCLINESFVDNFDGVFTRIEFMPKKKHQIQSAIIGMSTSECYASMTEVKMCMIEIITNDI